MTFEEMEAAGEKERARKKRDGLASFTICDKHSNEERWAAADALEKLGKRLLNEDINEGAQAGKFFVELYKLQ